ncbi:MAG TPA: hypothetical protein VKA41_04710 [Solirubrobacterales bacterium]|nr:hypothetical protein [Solirubrobacterales bacterium]
MTTLESTTERLEEALRRLAVEAADLLEELLASGAEMPFDLEPSDDGPLPMFSYAPLTGQFIENHLAELRRLEAFLEVREIAGEEAAIGFLIGLWDGKTEFEVAGDRLRGAIDAVLSMIASDSDEATPAGEVIVPLVGFHMPVDKIELDGVRIVRADRIEDEPVDALDATRAGGRGKPGFMARVSCGLATVAPAAAVADDLRRALRTMRLFRPGAVGLHSHGWAKRSGGWERFGTGVGRPRQGGYRLTGNEAPELERFARMLAERTTRVPSLDWAASRFELGAERSSLIEALSDYLLALRGLLEGGGPARTSLSARVAALACEPFEREQGRVTVERALAIERKLMSGGRYKPVAGASPLDVIAEVEELLRRLLKGMAMGELGGDLRVAADEILLSEGLSAIHVDSPGVQETAEWRLPDPRPDETLDLAAISDANLGDAEIEVHREETEVEEAEGDMGTREKDASETNEIGDLSVRRGGEDRQPTTRIVVDEVELPEIMAAESDHRASPPPPDFGDRADWFSAGDGEPEWPAFASPRRKQKHDAEREPSTDRVRYLFPVPDATDWEVGELRYERKKSN